MALAGPFTLDIAIAVIGWTGVVLFLVAYALVSAGRLDAQSVTYQVMNAVGAAAFIVNSGWHGAMPSAVTNVIWMLIAVAALIGIVRKRARTG